MISYKSEIPVEKVKDLFCNEIGYQTPKLDTRAAVFKEDRILLVRESDGRWSLPGGWVDAGLSVKENAEKEVLEEAGLTVAARRIIAVQDRDKHNLPVYAYKVCKVFVECEYLSGEFAPNLETIASGYFGMDELPELATEKNNEEQVRMCFGARMGDAVIFETRQDFRAWLSENCRTHQGVGLLFGKAGGCAG